MKINNLKSLFAVAAFVLLTIGVNAQKFGYVNSALLLSELPEMKAADSELETYQKQLVSQGESMVKAFESTYQAIAKEVADGLLSQVQQQAKEVELQKQQQEIQAYEVEVQQKIVKKREELIQPILDKVKIAIEAVGKENGYTMIFDSVNGIILHANESDDVIALVKTKLGM
ncbi:MAG: OmpH family outer membrane protein [Saprospiraceae bacterium]|nr:OmpH family outer membrane protein [Bacteroidia bacterium]NNE14153.1 OmpH family outer membrane protein [Saprospiraceae bacterium]NNL93532.1 OmpH family outer membrane protein [Saprospiraceae bacterium]